MIWASASANDMERKQSKHGAWSAGRTEKQKIIHECWAQMRKRCFNSKHKQFKHYGGRGIQICAQWSLDFRLFWRDMESSWSEGLTIDRIDNDGHYNRINCRWATPKEQQNNRRKLPPEQIREVMHKALKAKWAKSMLQNFISITNGKIRTSKRAKNTATIKAYHHAYRIEHRETLCAKDRARYAKRREQLAKINQAKKAAE